MEFVLTCVETGRQNGRYRRTALSEQLCSKNTACWGSLKTTAFMFIAVCLRNRAVYVTVRFGRISYLQWGLISITASLLSLLLLFFPEQNKSQPDAVPPVFLRRNSFTPLSSNDQIKRPRLYSMGNPPHARMSHPPTLSSMQFFEGAELQLDEVGSKNSVRFHEQRLFFKVCLNPWNFQVKQRIQRKNN